MFRNSALFSRCFLSKISGKHAVDVHILQLIPFADMSFSGSFEPHSNFLKDSARSRVSGEMLRGDPFEAEFCESKVNEARGGFGREALIPELAANPIA